MGLRRIDRLTGRGDPLPSQAVRRPDHAAIPRRPPRDDRMPAIVDGDRLLLTRLLGMDEENKEGVAVAQRSGVVLSKEHHSVHHSGAYDSNYCITWGHLDLLLNRFVTLRK